MQPERFPSSTNELLGQVHIAVIRLDDKLDGLVDQLARLQKTVDDRHNDHEARIRVLEQRPYVSPGTVWKVIATLLSVVGVGLTIIGFVIK